MATRDTKTAFNVPAVAIPMHYLCRLALWLAGWRREGEAPPVPKCVIILAPHTSNWDLPIGLLFGFAFGLDCPVFLGKHTLFRGLLGALLRSMGGVPVERSHAHNLVDWSVNLFAERKRIALALTPEGTRRLVPYWKSGFYHIAHGANVPIAIAYLDYKRKVGGFGPLVAPTGNRDEDMSLIRNFYANITARHPENFAPPALKPPDPSKEDTKCAH